VTPEEIHIHREVARALLLTPDREILLIHCHHPRTGRFFWITPGGGRHEGEAALDCVRREVLEETGLESFEIGPHIWTREHTFHWDPEVYHQREEIYLVPAERFSPTHHHNPEPEELEFFRGFRWWTIDDIIVSDDTFAPRRLGTLAHDLVEHGVPAEPVNTGV
jgi:probable phosphoglycerate mutase